MSDDQPQPSTSNASPQFIETQRPSASANGVLSTSVMRRRGKEECEPLEKLVIAKKGNAGREQTVAIRIRAGTVSYSEWLTEVQVYLLPNFRHKNILPVAASESNKCNALARNGIKPLRNFKPKYNKGVQRLKLEYWITLKYELGYRTLREFLKTNVLTWTEMLGVAKGIMMGIYYMHENQEFQNFDVDESTRLFVKSTRGCLKRVIFQDPERIQRTLYAFPPMHLSVIHRNLSSQNIILKPDLTPCIWNFGSAHIQYPFQPVQRQQRNSSLLKSRQLTSPYSAPEVLMQMSPGTLAAYKAIDMYACGIIMWELLSRCDLPQLNEFSREERLDRRGSSRPYMEPYEDQLGPQPTSGKLVYAVCKKKVRPRLREGWMAGRKSYRFVRTIQDLWDHDFEARLHSATVIDRLNELIANDDLEPDQRPKQTWPVNKTLDPSVFNTWNLSHNRDVFLTPVPTLVEPNICMLSNRDKSVSVARNEMPEFLMDDDDESSEEDNGYTSDSSSNLSTLSREQQALSGGSVEWIELVQRTRTLTVIDIKEEPEFSIKMDSAPVRATLPIDPQQIRLEDSVSGSW